MERDGEMQTKGQLRAKPGVLYLIYHLVVNYEECRKYPGGGGNMMARKLAARVGRR